MTSQGLVVDGGGERKGIVGMLGNGVAGHGGTVTFGSVGMAGIAGIAGKVEPVGNVAVGRVGIAGNEGNVTLGRGGIVGSVVGGKGVSVEGF
ncbi:hypothetical protein F0562_003137 [Nyssa sinensis]|uniref:Uncharacterized protein n=1 Tax=Nyssa sinensis TaxID=561372 RepID=A0A5J5BVK0_9ASTE|nr:hypothetical protein F0562_003137 [Nyssa sinensis]